MKKILTLSIFLCLINSVLKAQTDFDLFGVSFIFDSSGYTGTAFTKVDPNTGNLTVLNTWSQDIVKLEDHTVDPKNKMYYQVVYQLETTRLSMFIIKIDMSTGIIADTVFTQDSLYTADSSINGIGGYINGLFYNCMDEHIYFLYNRKNKQVDNSSEVGTRLAKVDPIAGKTTLVTILPPNLYGRAQHCGKNQQKIFLYNYYNNNELTVYDLQTKQRSNILLSRNYSSSRYVDLVMNASDHQLYGYEMDYSTFTNSSTATSRMIKVDPADGLVTDLSDTFHLINFGTLSFEPTNNKVYFIGMNSNPGYIDLFSFDIYTKKRSLHKTICIPDVLELIGIDVVEDLDLDTAFVCKNLCQQIPVEFNPTTRKTLLEWDFGDPASGSLNASNRTNPQHVYTQPGTYTVKMTSSNCWKSNTITKTITIESLPAVDLGNDITWCSNKKHDELHLQVNAPGSTYLWQDQTTTDNYTVSKAGLYWVKVMNVACAVTDTLIANEITCPCDISVSPTITHSTASFIFECDLSSYDSLVLELYNERSQQVLRRDIREATTIVNFEQLAGGIYFYRVRDKNSVFKSGKIVFVR